MTQDDLPPTDDLEAWKARFGENRHIPLVRYGAFRVDREWNRTPSHPEWMWPWPELVFEITEQYEFDVVGLSSIAWAKWFPSPLAEMQVPTRAQVLHIATLWWAAMRPKPEDGMVSLACYRRRVGPGDDEQEMTPGDWYVGPLFRRPNDSMISMAEAAPLVEAALRQLQQAERDDEILQRHLNPPL